MMTKYNILFVICVLVLISDSDQVNDDYWNLRDKLVQLEKFLWIGGNITLTDKEHIANVILLRAKYKELDEGYRNVSAFLPSQHFFKVKDNIDKMELFKYIKKLPKGANLHTHILASVSENFIVNNITYREQLYGCFIDQIFKLQFFEQKNLNNHCEWKLLKNMREHNSSFDLWLKQHLTLKTDERRQRYLNITDMWKKFKNIFSTVYDMLTFRPVFEDFLYQSLFELYNDNVFYVEYRGNLMKLYEINGTMHDEMKFLEIFTKTVRKFTNNYQNFVGAKYIYSIYRGINETTLDNNIKTYIMVRNQYPDTLIGIDFVGFEDDGKPLKYFVNSLRKYDKTLKFFFHAGETTWYGHTDENLIDAVLLNSMRIGHAYGLLKHPEILKIVKENNIALEICPLSNQILMLVEDLRNHPAAVFIAHNLSVVICNDDPGFWGATGLSYDWYVTFLGMTSRSAGLEVLKQLALNSFLYSSLSDLEKNSVVEEWNSHWNNYLDYLIATNVS